MESGESKVFVCVCGGDGGRLITCKVLVGLVCRLFDVVP